MKLKDARGKNIAHSQDTSESGEQIQLHLPFFFAIKKFVFLRNSS